MSATRRLETYFALLSLLLCILGSAIALAFCMIVYSIPWTCVFVIAPIALFVFVISILIGHCLAEPLRLLNG